MEKKRVIIIGAGPAGLSSAYYLLKNTDIKPVILEESEYIGGISRTHVHNENRMDLGGHRFFTKSEEVMNLWTELFEMQTAPSKDQLLLNDAKSCGKGEFKAGSDPEISDNVLLKRRRISRIYFLKKFFDYPVSFKPETFLNMGFINCIFAAFGYLKACILKRKEDSLENFYINRFGEPLYKMFFEDYTKKVWGIHPSHISPDWGAQRVKGLSIKRLIENCFKKKNKVIETSLIEEFLYPKKGPGQLYEVMAEKIKEMGGTIIFNNSVIGIDFADISAEADCNNTNQMLPRKISTNSKISAVRTKDKSGGFHTFECDCVFSSMPVKDLVAAFNKDIDTEISDIAKNLPYRDFITAGLLLNRLKVANRTKIKTVGNIIPDCWIYIQERSVKLGRLQIFNNWSPYMVKDFENTVFIGLEYFCNESDSMWNMKEADFIEMASNELELIGIIDKKEIIDSTMIRVKKAYPAYFGSYKDFEKLRLYLDSVENLYCIGRNGQHRYNNMDHSILTGFEAARAFINNTDREKVWKVNTEDEYHEEK